MMTPLVFTCQPPCYFISFFAANAHFSNALTHCRDDATVTVFLAFHGSFLTARQWGKMSVY